MKDIHQLFTELSKNVLPIGVALAKESGDVFTATFNVTGEDREDHFQLHCVHEALLQCRWTDEGSPSVCMGCRDQNVVVLNMDSYSDDKMGDAIDTVLRQLGVTKEVDAGEE